MELFNVLIWKKIRMRIVWSLKNSENIKDLGRLIILIDQETGVNYLQSWVGGGSSITPLLDERGEVVIDITPQM